MFASLFYSTFNISFSPLWYKTQRDSIDSKLAYLDSIDYLFRCIKQHKVNANMSSEHEDKRKRKAVNETPPHADHEALTDATNLVRSLSEATAKMGM